MTGLAISPSKLFCNLSAPNVALLFMMLCCSPRIAAGDVRVVDRVVAPTLSCLAWGDGCR